MIMIIRRIANVAAIAALTSPALAGDFDCVIEPRQVLEIRSPIEGLIDKVHVNRGDIVRKGQVIAEIDSAVERAAAAIAQQRASMEGAVLAGKSRVEFSGHKADRAKQLHSEKYVSAEARDQALTEHRLAKAELQDAEDNRRVAELEYKRQMEIIRLKTIRSPVDAVVIERIQNAGELAEAGVGRKPIFKLAEIGVLHVEVLLPAKAYGKVKLATQVDVKPEIPAGTQYRATVKVVDRVLDTASGTFGVRLELPNPQRNLVAGIRCTATFPDIEAVSAPKARALTRERSIARPEGAPAFAK
jgi:RND family efflux transporter MFP subunit